MTCLQTAAGALPPKSSGSISIQTEQKRTLWYIYRNLTESRDAWFFPALFVVCFCCFMAMIINGIKLYVLPNFLT
ncbi:unnamed protein product [Larinioides sclopetarius]